MSRRRLELVELPDGRREFGWMANGLPTFPFGLAPKGLATRRQLRAAGLCPGGQDIVAQLVWRGGRAWAGLYDLNLARPKRTPTLAQRQALNKAMRARRRCGECGRDAGYCLPRTNRTCWNCTNNTTTAATAA
ncbi:RRQRL motif-containing zinc-binding protein [Saccharopolyspora sp. NPDC002686]|uniref:RRQRL motif-containing zinc-binding protein n=1 Tax=Saccharopolyspora sp. NPDC002686 TaxID=3154541 RepID=UPI0033247879